MSGVQAGLDIRCSRDLALRYCATDRILHLSFNRCSWCRIDLVGQVVWVGPRRLPEELLTRRTKAIEWWRIVLVATLW